MLFLKLYREREQEFNSGQKRHNKIWSEIAFEMEKSNYNVSCVQVQNKMSSLKRTYKKIKDSNVKTGNHNSTWAFYSAMDSLFSDKGWFFPSAVASSEGPATPSTSISSCPSPHFPSIDNFECQDISSCKPKKRKEMILESFIIDLKNNKDQLKEERKKELLKREKKRLERWEINRAERKEMHKETSDIQKSLVNVLQQLVQQQNNPK